MNLMLSAKNWLFSAFSHGHSPRRMAISCALGMYVALSPFIGLHTGMVMLSAWIFSLNGIVMLALSKVVNNPLTVVPLYAAGHALGWRILSFVGIDPVSSNPAWMSSFNDWIAQHIGLSSLSFWAFMVGTNIMAVGVASLSYVLIKWYLELAQQGTPPCINPLKKSRQAARSLVAKAQPVLMEVTKRRAHRSA